MVVRLSGCWSSLTAIKQWSSEQYIREIQVWILSNLQSRETEGNGSAREQEKEQEQRRSGVCERRRERERGRAHRLRARTPSVARERRAARFCLVLHTLRKQANWQERERPRERERERQSQERPAAQQSEALRPQKCVLNSRASTTATRYPSARAISHAPVVHRSQRVLVLVLES